MSTLFFRNRTLLVLSSVVVVMGGLSAYQALPRLEDPVITMRNPVVLTTLPGASAERVEALVTKPLEDALSEVSGIKTIESTSAANLSSINIELMDSATWESIEAVFTRIRDQVNRTVLPAEAGRPQFDDKRGAQAFTLILAFTWTQDDREPLWGVMQRQAEVLADRIRALPGTELARIYGGVEEEFQVLVDSRELAARSLRMGHVVQSLQSADSRAAAGVVQMRGERLPVEVEPGLERSEELSRTPVGQGWQGDVVRVMDVATVERAWTEPREDEVKIDGRPSVLLATRVERWQQADVWAGQVFDLINQLQADLGVGIELEVVFDQTQYTNARLGELVVNLALGAVVVALVVLVTMGWRSALITGSALPLTMCATLFLISLSGGSIHQMSVFGMIIALGLLIDNAIVMTDEVSRRLREGYSRTEAVGGAVKHLFVPLLSSSLTTMLAFAPIMLLPGNAGDFVGSIGSSVSFAIGSSFFLAMTLIAAFAGYFSYRNGEEKITGWWQTGIQIKSLETFWSNAARGGLLHPWRAVGLSLLVPMLGFVAAASMGMEFFPRTDRNMFQIQTWLPRSVSMEETMETLQEIEDALRERPEVVRVFWRAGGDFPSVYYNLLMRRDNSSEFGHLIVETHTPADVQSMLKVIVDEYGHRFPQAQLVANQFAQGPPVNADVEFRLVGEHLDDLVLAGERVQALLVEHPEMQTVRTTLGLPSRKMTFIPDRATMEVTGWDPRQLQAELAARLDGQVATVITEDLQPMQVRVRLQAEERQGVESLWGQVIAGPNGEWMPVETLGSFEYRQVQNAIQRKDRERINTVQGFVTQGALPIEVTNQIMNEIAERGDDFLPAGIRLELGGDAESQSDAVGGLTLFAPILATLTVGTLVLSFRSVLMALILTIAAFLAVGYGLLATWALGFPLSFNVILGSLGLVGLAFNASIVVLASIRANAQAALGEVDAMVVAVKACGRHLASTTLTTIGGFLPLLVLVGGDFWPPLAIVLVGGVGGSTLLALFLTPTLYRWWLGQTEDGQKLVNLGPPS
ncbi:MAG: efflux RND transporter permease subunit [Verrucomicrobiales bacterium]